MIIGIISSCMIIGTISSYTIISIISRCTIIGIISSYKIIGIFSSCMIIGIISSCMIIGINSSCMIIGTIISYMIIGIISISTIIGTIMSCIISIAILGRISLSEALELFSDRIKIISIFFNLIFPSVIQCAGRKTLEMVPPGRRRQKHRWVDCVNRDMRAVGTRKYPHSGNLFHCFVDAYHVSDTISELYLKIHRTFARFLVCCKHVLAPSNMLSISF